MKKIVLATVLAALSTSALAADEGYYGVLRYVNGNHHAKNQEVTSPRTLERVAAEDRNSINSGAIGIGYDWGNNWRTEAEYNFKTHDTFASWWRPFEANANTMNVKSERLMLNVYRDFPIAAGFSLFAMGGVGLTQYNVEGWQGNQTRRFAERTDTNLTWAVGAGASYAFNEMFTVETGYRYTDMGTVESGFNTFANRPGTRDEQMQASLVSSEWYLGGRVKF
ncbi:porin [Enterobacterales bacterium CwR94]|nr:porin [Enterobacterales bacterium CwR94]